MVVNYNAYIVRYTLIRSCHERISLQNCVAVRGGLLTRTSTSKTGSLRAGPRVLGGTGCRHLDGALACPQRPLCIYSWSIPALRNSQPQAGLCFLPQPSY